MSIYKGTQLISGVATPVEAGRNIGQIISSLLPLTDSGLRLLDGSLINGNGIYKSFVDYIKTLDLTANYFTTEANWQASVEQYGVCGKFVYDASANTVRLPKVTGHVEGTLDPNALGDLVEAGLPNIEGTLGAVAAGTQYNTYTSGAFTNPKNVSTTGTFGSNNGYRVTYDLDASLSNPIYGNNETVQTQSILGYMYIVLATGTKTDVEVDIDNIVTDLNQKVDKSSMVDAGSYIAGCAMPSDTYVDLTLGSSGATYTAPANGWFNIGGIGSSTTQGYVFMFCNATSIKMEAPCSSGLGVNLSLPVKKGDVMTINYAFLATGAVFRFTYAEGEV